MKDIVQYVSLFTIRHALRCWRVSFAVSWRIRTSLMPSSGSRSYKAFDNMDGFQRFFAVQPNPRAAVLVFGLFHGFGLATKPQDFALSPNGLVVNHREFQRER